MLRSSPLTRSLLLAAVLEDFRARRGDKAGADWSQRGPTNVGGRQTVVLAR
ncbi:MAG: hypothetical protein RBT60_08460 [Candidatus Krumholzibacteria bacterium]|jgi:hypothetical protein|nr:hypothetical protein [Candidatus Krumholzibacteria bacterium]